MSHRVTPFLLGSSRVPKSSVRSSACTSYVAWQTEHLLVQHLQKMSSENLDTDTQVDYEEEKQDSQEKNANPVKAEEAKLKAKYPGLGQKPGGSDFLMKRLQKGQKYFDSGDYNMAKAKMKNKQLPVAFPDLK
ncbi:unnamed protein product [Menidia menidia]|uniref:Alpha-endosulfine n=1 Tax=Menidia menidia TaxID=238744 RepID=A0A8S4BQC2_9TELE|nr:unnamed protein product [Menidia menidia]